MKVIIKWRYPDETEIHENTFYDVDPTTVIIYGDRLSFAPVNNRNNNWSFALNHVVEMRIEVE